MIVLFAWLMWAGIIVLLIFLNIFWKDEPTPKEVQEFAEYHRHLCTETKCDFSEEEARKLYQRFYERRGGEQSVNMPRG